MYKMKLKKSIAVVIALGVICSYFFITGAYPIGLLSVPVCLYFFKFSKEKLSVHINIFSLIATIIGIIIYIPALNSNLKSFILYFFAILLLTVTGKILKNKYLFFIQIFSLAVWCLTIIAFLTFSTASIYISQPVGRLLKLFSVFICGCLGLPPSHLLIPTVSFCHSPIPFFCVTLMLTSLPAVLINLKKDFKITHLDFKFFTYYMIGFIIGTLIAFITINSTENIIGETIFQLSLIIPSIISFIITLTNNIKTFKKIKK